MSVINWSIVHTCKDRLGFSLLPFTLIPQYLKRFNWSIQWNPLATHLWLVLVGFHDFQTLPDRTSRAWSVEEGKPIFGLSLFRPSRQSSIPTSVPRRAMKDSNIPSPERTRSVKCPTPGPTTTIKSPPHTLPPHPPRRLYIDRCIIIDKLSIQTLIIFLLRNSLVSLRYLWRNVQKKRHARAKLLFF